MMTMPPTPFDAEVINIIDKATNQLALRHARMISGAGHDAMNIATVAPTSMIFVPYENGISHNEAESPTAEDLAEDANVLLHSLLAFSGVAN